MMDGLRRDDWERPDGQIRYELAVARTIMAWNDFELHLIFYFEALSGLDHFRARTIWGSIPSFEGKKKMLIRLSNTFADKPSHEKFEAYMKRASSLAANRNLVAHGLGGFDASRNKVSIMQDIQDQEIGINFVGHREYQLANIEGWPHAIRQLIHEMMAYLNGFAGQVSALSRMHSQAPRG